MEEPTHQEIVNKVDSLYDQMKATLLEFVAIDSRLLTEKAAQDYVAQFLTKELDAKIERMILDKKALEKMQGYSPVDWDYQNRDVIVGTIEPKKQIGKSLIFNGHIDVVPTGIGEFLSNLFRSFESVDKIPF
jgi:acetylornithine deacetylase